MRWGAAAAAASPSRPGERLGVAGWEEAAAQPATPWQPTPGGAAASKPTACRNAASPAATTRRVGVTLLEARAAVGEREVPAVTVATGLAAAPSSRAAAAEGTPQGRMAAQAPATIRERVVRGRSAREMGAMETRKRLAFTGVAAAEPSAAAGRGMAVIMGARAAAASAAAAAAAGAGPAAAVGVAAAAASIKAVTEASAAAAAAR